MSKIKKYQAGLAVALTLSLAGGCSGEKELPDLSRKFSDICWVLLDIAKDLGPIGGLPLDETSENPKIDYTPKMMKFDAKKLANLVLSKQESESAVMTTSIGLQSAAASMEESGFDINKPFENDADVSNMVVASLDLARRSVFATIIELCD